MSSVPTNWASTGHLCPQIWYATPDITQHQQDTIASQYAFADRYALGQTQSAPVFQPLSNTERIPADAPFAPFIIPENRQHLDQNPHLGMQQAFFPPFSLRGSHDSMLMGDLAPQKTIKANKTYDPKDAISFNTPIDELVKILGPVPNPDSQLPTPNPASSSHSRVIHAPSPSVASSNKYFCDGPDCSAVFYHKAHLKAHKTTHTGDKPFVCSEPRVFRSFLTSFRHALTASSR